MSNRRAVIDHVLSDLQSLRRNPSFPNQYAVEENIAFFEAIKSFPSYLKWLFIRAPKIDGMRLLELTDFPFPHWDKEMHLKLIEIEKKNFPGLVKPLVNRVVQLILQGNEEQFIGASFGCGGMEVESQIIKKLLEEKYKGRVVLIGIDNSSVVHEVAKKNLKVIEPFIEIYEIENLDKTILDNLLKRDVSKHVIVLCKNNIFNLPKHFDPKSFDVMYHSLFKHHLTKEGKAKVDWVANLLSKHVLEYDVYKSWPTVIPQTMTGWNHPVFFNAELFSNLRALTKNEISSIRGNWKLRFFKVGTYLAESGCHFSKPGGRQE